MTVKLNFQNLQILIIGDIMLDRYWWGNVSRISPEAPVPIIQMDRSTLVPGGAANVAANIAGLGAVPILVGCIGDDSDGLTLDELLNERSISTEHLIRVADRPSTVKTRIIAHNQHVARVDHEMAKAFSEDDESRLMDMVLGQIDRSKAVVISDYAKGVVSESLVQNAIIEAKTRGIPVIVDPKGKDYTKYRGATVLTPNRKEATEACNLEDSDSAVDESGRKLLDLLEVEAVLITQGEDGMTLFTSEAESVRFPAASRDVFDVTGAGDTVIATLAVSLAAGSDLEPAAQLANTAAGIVVGHVGTAPIDISELRTDFELFMGQAAGKKGLT